MMWPTYSIRLVTSQSATGGDSGLNSNLAHEKATKMLRVLAQKAHNRGFRLESKNKSNSSRLLVMYGYEGEVDMNLLKAYEGLMKALEKDCKVNKPQGIGGMWTPDGEEDNGDLIHRTYAGGYEHTLMSRKFDFEIVEGYTDANGSQARLSRGTLDGVQAALDHYKVIVETDIPPQTIKAL